LNWGKLSWNGLHPGQESTSEIVIAGDNWFQLNPVFSYFSPDGGIPENILDCLATYDFKDSSYYPHLAYNWTMLSDTHIRVNLRQGIKWHIDPEGFYPDEYFDADDVIFSYYVWRYISDYKTLFYDIKDVKKVDQFTVDFYFDLDPLTPEEEPTVHIYDRFNLEIIPEHYLNQTQLPDGITPDITHNSWHTFASECFGTGLFELDDFLEIEVTLDLFEDSWWLDPSVDKSNMDFETRFGNFSGGLDRLKIRRISDNDLRLVEFQRGKLDYTPIVSNLNKRDDFAENPDFNVHSMYTNYIEALMFNLREDRPIIASQEPAPGDPSITKGLAIRKAISYAIDREEINQVLFGGEYILQDHPISIILGKWCYPDIIRYNYDLDKAKEYMQIAGYGEEQLIPSGLSGWEIAGIVVSSVIFTGVVSFVIYWLYRKGK
jgi:peptide/nickel transport system substrate-binding protein